MVRLKNLTPHPVTILDGENNVIKTIPSDGLVRLKASTVSAGYSVDGIPISKTVFGDPEGLPDTQQWIAYSQGNPETGFGFSPEEAEDDFCGKTYRDRAEVIEPLFYYIVSQLVKNALPHRDDLLVPAEVQRDTSGNIIGCRSLGM